MNISYKQETLLDGQSMAASFNSEPISVLEFNGYSIQCVWTGSPTGTLKLQISNDTEEPTNWDDLDDSSVSITTAGSETYIVAEVEYGFVRIVYTRSSGTGSFGAKFVGKGT